MDCYVADGYWVNGYTEEDVCAITPAGSLGGGGTIVRKGPEPKMRQGKTARQTIEEEYQRLQPKPAKQAEPVKAKVEKPKRKRVVYDPVTEDIRDVLDQIYGRVQAEIDAAAVIQVAQDAEMLAQAVWLAQDEADVEVLLMAAW